jgi:hypothetical protein
MIRKTMGQEISSPGSNVIDTSSYTSTVDEKKIASELENFNMASKSGIGVHMFCFTPPLSNKSGAAEKIYLASEVTDENDVLDVKYRVWKKKFVASDQSSLTAPAARFAQPESKLKVVWSPDHRFSSGRLAMVAAKALLNQGYTVKECSPENEI